jgi:lysozyme
MVATIIDIYYANDVEPAAAQQHDVVAIIHKASEALHFRDPRYQGRKQAAKDLGLLWGAYHLSSAEDPEAQVDFFLDTVGEVEHDVLLALDWEASKNHGQASKDQTHDFISAFHDRTGRYPVLYGGHTIRDACAHGRDSILARCPLWYVRYRSTPKDLPTNTWQNYTLWQYSNGNPNVDELPAPTYELRGADWNRYNGSLEQLRESWPFLQ